MTDETFLRLLDTVISEAHASGYYQGKMETISSPVTKADYSEYDKLNKKAIAHREDAKKTLITRVTDLTQYAATPCSHEWVVVTSGSRYLYIGADGKTEVTDDIMEYCICKKCSALKPEAPAAPVKPEDQLPI